MKRNFFGLLTLILALGYTSCVSKMDSLDLVSKVMLNKTTAYMAANTTLQLTTTVFPVTAINKNVTWKSSNATVATVSETGLVSAKASGTATITVTSESGYKTAACTITVVTEDIFNILSEDLFEKLIEFGIEINIGNNPPNIEGIYLVKPTVLEKSNFDDVYPPGQVFADMLMTFSNQDNAKLTISVECDTGGTIWNNINSFITGNGNKFSVFLEMESGKSKLVEIYSGEITPTGIKNLYNAFIWTSDSPNKGNGRLLYDGDGFSEKVASTRTTSNVSDILLNIHSKGIK